MVPYEISLLCSLCCVPVWYPGNASIHREVRGRRAPTDSDTQERGLLNKNFNTQEVVLEADHHSEEDNDQNPGQHDGPDKMREETVDEHEV